MTADNTGPMGPRTVPLARAVGQLLEEAVWSELGAGGDEALASFRAEVARPANPEHGDLASNLALKLAKPLRRPPMAIAEAVAGRLRASAGGDTPGPVGEARAAPPGFINVVLAPAWLEHALDAARALGARYGLVQVGEPQRINVEFVSANPTGPLHIGNARGAFVGDLLCRALEGAGHDVTREYYFNDAGAQVEMLGLSVYAARTGGAVPEDGYHGQYVSDLARRLPDELWSRATESGAHPGAVIGPWAAERIRGEIESSLARLGVRFDVWTTERRLESDGWMERALARVREAGHLYVSEGATWFRSTAFGDDKDRVVVRSNGESTYFAKDLGYLLEKFSRGFELLIYIWGADHHGTVARLRNGGEALGFDRERVQVLLTAWVRFVRDGREISMSKRSGEFITLDEVLTEIGPDAARWFFAARSPQTGIDFDIELAKRQSNENPVYYVQYAHARISSILRKAAEAGMSPADSLVGTLGDDPVALGLAKEVLRLPDAVDTAARDRETQPLTTYATDLATTFHAYYRDRRVVDPADPATSAARLALADATRLALANALGLLGISAPESM